VNTPKKWGIKMPKPMNEFDQNSSNQPKKKNCLEMLHSILDGEASTEEKQHFVDMHLDSCMPCYKKYHLEMAIRELLKSKCGSHQAPTEIVENIKNLINSAD
jgi:anti-sigma factor (TIGR02949 family)